MPPPKSGPKYFCIKFRLSAFSPGILKIGKKLIYINFVVALIQEKVNDDIVGEVYVITPTKYCFIKFRFSFHLES